MMYLMIIGIIAGVMYFTLLKRYGNLWDSIETETFDLEKQVSIIIPFRNEEGNLDWILNSLFYLNIEDYKVEVLFIDDHSTDNSVKEILDAKLQLDFRIIGNSGEGKKDALRTGWEQAKYDIILQTDADCMFEEDWLQTMLSAFGEEVEMVSGPVRFFNGRNFWQKIVQIDFAGLIAIGAAHIQWKRPMLCNGANLAYRKSVIESAELNDEKASGDDVFLMQTVFQKNENGIRFCKDYSACVGTPGPETFGEFYHQRLRWSSKNSDYADKNNTRLLIGLWLYNVLIVVCFLMGTLGSLTLAAYLIILKIVAEDGFYSRFVEFFKFEGWFSKIFFGQPFHILYMVVMPVLSQVLSYKWKDRKLR